MEYLELYDENRQPLGITITRGEAVPPNAYMLTVGIWIVNDQKQVLLTRRSLEKRYAPGKWENPSGHVQKGETREDAIIRELREETGIIAQKESIHHLGTVRVWPYFGDNYVVRMNVDLADVRLQPGETCDVRWATLAELDDMLQNGRMAPSTLKHMAFYREAFERWVK
ncbi:MAG: NUDIX domain-containing protein [Clostridia bacterium]|nr:NUDIX domain-containing protein [Clostridia bacterium]